MLGVCSLYGISILRLGLCIVFVSDNEDFVKSRFCSIHFIAVIFAGLKNTTVMMLYSRKISES